jgi:hypothetical protein
MSKQQLEQEIEDMELVGLMEDMEIKDQGELKEGEEAEGIDDLIAKMEKVTIEK